MRELTNECQRYDIFIAKHRFQMMLVSYRLIFRMVKPQG